MTLAAALRPAHDALVAHRAEIAEIHVADLFANDPNRFADFQVRLDDLLFDYSKHPVTRETMGLLFDLARAAKFDARRAALFAGEIVNVTEHRPALHMALRNLTDRPMMARDSDGTSRDVMGDVRAERARVAAFATKIRTGVLRGATGEPFTDIVNIGIGGSDLGPAMGARALAPYGQKGLAAHFVSNVDGADIGDTLRTLDAARTLFIVSSKTFTTQETMTNAATARAFVAGALGEQAVGDHFAAVSTQLDKVAAFGIGRDRVFGFWDWVGGRYSMWSAIGLGLTILIGPDKFEDFLRGGQDVDLHFRDTPMEHNIPALMGLLGVWQRNFWHRATQAVIPYDQRLGRFPAYLQQLDMESNGKSVTLGGSPAPLATGPVVFGEPGTNGQHAFFQLLHQGTEVVPIDFLVAAEPTDADAHHHALLVANCFAQGEALMRGRSRKEVEAILTKQGMAPDAIRALAPHKVFSGDRPSSTFLYRKLDPHALGRLVALYEHKIFTQSVIWDINPFDQWGVELGKELANRLAPIVEDASKSTSELDGSTAGLIGWRRTLMAG
jgi:glucose-6-phosphate isomerase